MIHIAGILFLATGVGIASLPLSGIQRSVQKKLHRRIRIAHQRQNKKNLKVQKYPDLLLNIANTEAKLPATPESNLLPSLVTPVNRRNPYRFPVMTGMLGLSTFAQFSAPALIPPSLITIGYLSKGIYQEAGNAIFKEKRVQVDILDATVITLCIGFRQVAAAGFMIWVLDIADLLLEKTRNRSERYLTDIFGAQARTAWRIIDDQEVEVEIKTLQKGDIIVVNTGEQVPVDGVITYGAAMIDQHSLTGESAPVEKHNDDKVFATTVLVAGKIHMQVQETGSKTLAGRIIDIINDASNFKVELQSSGERIADRMVIPTLGLGLLGYFTAGPSGMLAIINADYGTGIRVAAPIALLASLGWAAQHGVLIRDSKVFEMLKKIDVVLFDKTSTLIYDVPAIAQIISTDEALYSPERILYYTAIAEQKFSHPIAKAILKEAHEQGMTLPPHDESRYHVGFGIEVMVHNNLVKVGSTRYMEQEQIPLPSNVAKTLDATRQQGHSAILVAINNQVIGLIELQSAIRKEAVDIINQIRQRGIQEIMLISGDHDAPTKELAHQLQMDHYFASVLPHEKADHVRRLQAEGKKVMMIGDGINDSAALSLADIAISLQGASTIAVDVADVVFMDGSLEKFDYLFRATDVLHANIRRSFALVALPNTVCIIGGLSGYFGLAASLVLNNGFNFISAVNGAMAYKEIERAEKKEIIAKKTTSRQPALYKQQSAVVGDALPN